MFQLKIELILHEISHPVGVNFIELGDERSSDEAMLESQPDFFATAEDELIKIVEDELEGFRVSIIDLYNLADATGVEGLILYVAKIAENLLYFLLHSIIYKTLYPPSIYMTTLSLQNLFNSVQNVK